MTLGLPPTPMTFHLPTFVLYSLCDDERNKDNMDYISKFCLLALGNLVGHHRFWPFDSRNFSNHITRKLYISEIPFQRYKEHA
jgi:hypothetical protein